MDGQPSSRGAEEDGLIASRTNSFFISERIIALV